MITFERSEKNPNSDISQWSASRTDNPLDYIVREDVIQAKYENSVSGDERERFENILAKKNDKEISRNRIPKDRHTISKAFSTEITTDKIHKNVKQEKISHVSARNTAGDNLRHAKSEMNIINGSQKINNSRSSTDLFQDDPVKINMFKSLFVKGDIRMDHVVDQAVATVLNKQGKTGKKYHHTDSKNIENELQNFSSVKGHRAPVKESIKSQSTDQSIQYESSKKYDDDPVLTGSAVQPETSFESQILSEIMTYHNQFNGEQMDRDKRFHKLINGIPPAIRSVLRQLPDGSTIGHFSMDSNDDGEISIQLFSHQDGLEIRIDTENDDLRQKLMQARDQITGNLNDNGIEVSLFQIKEKTHNPRAQGSGFVRTGMNLFSDDLRPAASRGINYLPSQTSSFEIYA